MDAQNMSHFDEETQSRTSVKLTMKESEQYHLTDLNECIDGNSSPESIHANHSLTQGVKGDVLNTLSGLYAEIVIIATGTSILAEILHGPLPLFYIHDFLFLYLLGLGIFIFIGTYAFKFRGKVSHISDENDENLPSLSQNWKKENCLSHIAMIFFKVGMSVFGFTVLITSLLEIVSIFMSPNKCISTLSSSQPFMRCIFILLQICFIKNLEAIISILGCVRNLAIMHLFAANVAMWIRLLIWESAKDWEGAVHFKHNSSVDWDKHSIKLTVHSLESDAYSKNASEHYPNHVVRYTSNCWWRVQESPEIDVTSVQYCLQNSTVGVLWGKMDEFFYPLKTQYYFIIAFILYAMWVNYYNQYNHHKYSLISSTNANKGGLCNRSTKGCFLGSIIFSMSVIVLIIFFSVERNLDLMISIAFCVIFALSTFAAILGVFQVKKMYSWKSNQDIQFIKLIQTIGLFAVYVNGSFNAISGSLSEEKQNFILGFEAVGMIVQATVQYLFIIQVSKKRIDVSNVNEKPGRQVVVFLILSNVSLWLLECFVSWNHLRQYYQLVFGETVWPVVTRCVLPFVVFYRFHSAAVLTESWFNTYR